MTRTPIRRIVCGPLFVTFMLVACSMSPAGAARATSASTSPLGAVRTLVIVPRTQQYACARAYWPGSEKGAFGSACPITARLRAWLLAHPIGPSGGFGARPPQNVLDGDPICRCQASIVNAALHVDGVTTTSARVTATIKYGLTPPRITFVVLHRAGSWRVDDAFCQGRPQTSIYRLTRSSPVAMITCG